MKTAVITCFFNPEGYESRVKNFATFARALQKQKIPLYTIEAVFPGQQTSLGKFANVKTVSCEAVLWQKESLLNLLLKSLHPRYEGIVWCDADVLFENKNWFRQTSRLLARAAVVQPFAEAVRLPQGVRRFVKRAECFSGFGAIYAEKPQLLLKGDFAAHGHTGFAWAARREVIAEHGLYDAMIAGSGDHVMAHAFAGDFESRCIRRIMGENDLHIAHFRRWASRMYPQVRGRIGYVPGRLLHLWHGDTEHRRYVDRNRELAGFGFDPERHLERDPLGLWRWRAPKPGLRGKLDRLIGGQKQRAMSDWAVKYFATRREDG